MNSDGRVSVFEYALGSLLQALVSLAAGGGSTFTGWVAGLSRAMAQFASWSQRMASNDQLKGWLKSGAAAAASLYRSMINLGATIKSVMDHGYTLCLQTHKIINME